MDVETGEGGQPGRAPKLAGTPFGKYTLLCRLATGGMGELFVARSGGAGGFEKLVVIKRLLPHLAEDAHFVAMLLDEARVAARLSHPNVCQVYDLGEVEGHYYIAMEHLEGVPASLVLRQASRAGQRLELGLATAILRQAADGLDHAHELRDRDGKSVGLVHRDVSPSNLFATASGVVKVLDFGVAKSQDALARTHTGALKGKYAYMSPEHVLGDAVDRRSDVWSLGVVLYELLTAQRLFWRDSEYKMFKAIVDEPVPPLRESWPGLPPAVAEVAERALSRDPGKRFTTARELGEALEEAMTGAGGIWRPARVGDYVAEHFGPLLEQRRQEVQDALAGRARLPSADGEAGDRGGELAADELHIDLGSVGGTLPRRRRGGRAWLTGLVAVAALGGGGALAYRQWMSGPAPRPTPVIVLGGEVETTDGRVTRASERGDAPGRPPRGAAVGASGSGGPDEAGGTGDESGAHGASGAGRDGDDGQASGASGTGGEGEARGASGTGETTGALGAGAGSGIERGAGDPYGAALARQQEQFRRCLGSSGATIAGAPELSVVLAIDRHGEVTRASLEPAELEATQLGDCILKVARRARFGHQREPVHVTIPLRVRRTR